MGDMADWCLEQVEVYEDLRWQYIHGQIDELEAYDAGIIDEHGCLDGSGSTYKICRCCGKTGLTWGRHRGKWRLFDGGKIHVCAVNPLKD